VNKGLKISAYATAALVFAIGGVLIIQGDVYGWVAIAVASLFSIVINRTK